MQKLLDIALAASGSPNEVKEKIAAQVQAVAGDGQAGIIAALRQFIDKRVEGVSEDDTISVTATATIDVHDVPPIVTARQQAAVDAFAREKRGLQAELAQAKAAFQSEVIEVERLTTLVTEMQEAAALPPDSPDSPTPIVTS